MVIIKVVIVKISRYFLNSFLFIFLSRMLPIKVIPRMMYVRLLEPPWALAQIREISGKKKIFLVSGLL